MAVITRGRMRLRSDLRLRFESLTPREQQVMSLVTAGLMNKQTAAQVGLSEVTVKIHRGNVMRKMRADSFAALVNMASRLRLVRPFATPAMAR